MTDISVNWLLIKGKNGFAGAGFGVCYLKYL
jgi:hypothetical protein